MAAEIHAKLEKIGIDDILSTCELVQRSRSWGGCDVYRWTLDSGKEILIKSLRYRPLWLRLLYGRHILQKENRNLKVMQDKGICVPHPYGIEDKDYLLEEFLSDGKPLLSNRHYNEQTKPSRDFFDQLVQIIKSMHEMKICHGDFHRANVFILENGKPCLLDVATAICIHKESSWWDRLKFKVFEDADNFSLAKIAGSYYPEMVKEEPLKSMLENVPWYLKLGSLLRHKVYRRIRGKRKRPSSTCRDVS